MQYPYIQKFDLNLLLSFQALIEDRNITMPTADAADSNGDEPGSSIAATDARRRSLVANLQGIYPNTPGSRRVFGSPAALLRKSKMSARQTI